VPEDAIKKKIIQRDVKVLRVINENQPVFDALLHGERSLPASTPLRIVLIRDELAMVTSLEDKFV